MMPMQKNVKITAAHMNYKVSRKLIFKCHKCFRGDRESLKADFHSVRPVNLKWHNLAESLMDAYRYRQGHFPTSWNGKDARCFQIALTDVNKIWHLVLGFVVLEVKKYKLEEQLVSFKVSNLIRMGFVFENTLLFSFLYCKYADALAKTLFPLGLALLVFSLCRFCWEP